MTKTRELTLDEVMTINEVMYEWSVKHPNATIEQYNRKLSSVVREILEA